MQCQTRYLGNENEVPEFPDDAVSIVNLFRNHQKPETSIQK